MKKDKLKALVIEKAGKDWGMVNMTELMESGRWVCGLNIITSLEDVVEQAEKANMPIIHRKYLKKLKKIRKEKMNDKEKKKIAKEITDITNFHLRALNMEITEENLKFGIQMFVEGVKFIKEKEKEE